VQEQLPLPLLVVLAQKELPLVPELPLLVPGLLQQEQPELPLLEPRKP